MANQPWSVAKQARSTSEWPYVFRFFWASTHHQWFMPTWNDTIIYIYIKFYKYITTLESDSTKQHLSTFGASPGASGACLAIPGSSLSPRGVRVEPIWRSPVDTQRVGGFPDVEIPVEWKVELLRHCCARHPQVWRSTSSISTCWDAQDIAGNQLG